MSPIAHLPSPPKTLFFVLCFKQISSVQLRTGHLGAVWRILNKTKKFCLDEEAQVVKQKSHSHLIRFVQNCLIVPQEEPT